MKTLVLSERLAVLLPAYNCPESLARTLASMVNCETACDIYLVDDGSEPALDITGLEPAGCCLILLRMAKNGGITRALNFGLEHIMAAGHAFIARIDAGDLYVHGRFSKQMAFLRAHPNHAVVGSWINYMDENRRPLFTLRQPVDHAALLKAFRYNNHIAHPSAMLRSDALRQLGGYSEAYPAAEDYELFFRLSRKFHLANLPEVLLDYEVSPHQISNRRKTQSNLSRLRIQLRYFDFWDIHSWLGAARTLTILMIPRPLLITSRALKDHLIKQLKDSS